MSHVPIVEIAFYSSERTQTRVKPVQCADRMELKAVQMRTTEGLKLENLCSQSDDLQSIIRWKSELATACRILCISRFVVR